MSKFFNVLPTPKKYRFESGCGISVNTVSIVGDAGKELSHAMRLFSRDQSFTISDCADADLTVYVGENYIPAEYVSDEVKELFVEKYAREQGYVIERRGSRTVIFALSSLGAAYGVLTFRQLVSMPIGDFSVLDAPDFCERGVNWLIWAETGIWSYDFGDGIEAIKRRMIRKLDTLMLYKINMIYADGFGYDADRFSGYSDIMRTLSDEARERGIRICVGGYGMSYGMVGHLNAYQGKHFKNRTSYPDGEVYNCIGTHDPHLSGNVIKGASMGTCLSNTALTELKLEEMTDFIRKTHATALMIHNMDADEIHEQLWLARCPACRKRWPNDSLFAKDGCAGAFAEYIDAVLAGLRSVKDGDYDAERDLLVEFVSPGYLYAKSTSDADFDKGVRFWGAVTDYIQNPGGFAVGFREQFFYHDKDVPRVEMVKEQVTKARTALANFSGADGFYDDKLFTTTALLNYIMKGYDIICTMNSNALQEPLALFNAEYSWNACDSGFYNIERPKNYNEFIELYYALMRWQVKPRAIYGKGGMIDVICSKLYGEGLGAKMAAFYKESGKNGEPPILTASSVDIYTNFTKVVYPMRWDDEIAPEKEAEMLGRFIECAGASERAYNVISEALECAEGEIRDDIEFLTDCAYMGKNLTSLLAEYMGIYVSLADSFRRGDTERKSIFDRISSLMAREAEFTSYVTSHRKNTVDKFEGPFVRRSEMAEWLEYNTGLMRKSIEEGKRIPTDRKPLRTREWW